MDRIRQFATEERCSATIVTDTYYSVRCTRRGTSTRKGKLYCTQHNPVEVAKRDNARRSKWQQKWDLEDRQEAEAKVRQEKIEAKAALADQLAEAVLAYGHFMPALTRSVFPLHKAAQRRWPSLVALARRVKGESDGHQAVPGTD